MSNRKWTISLFIYFLLSRIVLMLLGVRFLASYDYMYFHGINEMTENFWQSLLYTHAFNPSMNILASFIMLFPEWLHNPLYTIIFWSLSFMLLFFMGKILSLFQLKDKVILFILLLFSLTPAFIYFESFLIYTLPSAAILMWVSWMFYRALEANTTKMWLIFFTSCVALSFVRSSYHIIWVICVLIGTILIDFRGVKKKLLGFSIPFAALFIWYFKNFLIFGFFGASSWSGFNLHFTTTAQLSMEEKTLLVAQGKLSPLVKIPIYSSVDKYADYFSYQDSSDISVLSDVMKDTGRPNYNHLGFIELSKIKMRDNMSFISMYPLRYLKIVLLGFIDYYNPSTKWHPHDLTKSPHINNRLAIGQWESVYNNVVHPSFTRGIGFYLIAIPIFLFCMLSSSIRFVMGRKLSNREKFMTFINWNIFYLMLISCLITYGELERYRFITEGLIWISVIVFITSKVNFINKAWIRKTEIE